MLDLKLIRNQTDEVAKRLQNRDPSIDLKEIIKLDQDIRDRKAQIEAAKNQRNKLNDEISMKRRKGEEASDLIEEMKNISIIIKEQENPLKELEIQLQDLLSRLPNLPHPEVPVSTNKEDKKILREFGSKPEFSFIAKNHLELAEDLHLLDFKRAVKLAGTQFSMWWGEGVLLELALINFMLDFHIYEKGFTPILPPYLVNSKSMFTSGNLPKFADQLYYCEKDDLWAIPTSEVSLTNLHREEMLQEAELPLKYVAFTPNFRREAGTYGKGERGLIRVHQFNKVEMYIFSKPEDSYQHFEELLGNAEELVHRLGLHYRVTLLVASDISQQAAKTCDIEVWLPGQEAYYEVSSVSNCEDYQARRGNIRYKRASDQKPAYLHTLNGSGLATSRLMVAILETYQQADGSIVIPEALRPYLKGKTVIQRKEKQE